MIVIKNISDKYDPFGEQEYEVRINKERITTFTHTRKEGLAVCLQRAANAVEKQELVDAVAILTQLPARRMSDPERL